MVFCAYRRSYLLMEREKKRANLLQEMGWIKKQREQVECLTSVPCRVLRCIGVRRCSWLVCAALYSGRAQRSLRGRLDVESNTTVVALWFQHAVVGVAE